MLDRMIEMQPHGVELGSQSERILGVLKEAAAWLNRKEIARAMGKNQLNPYDIAILQVLAAQGTIETEQRTNRSPVGWEWVYRAKQS